MFRITLGKIIADNLRPCDISLKIQNADTPVLNIEDKIVGYIVNYVTQGTLFFSSYGFVKKGGFLRNVYGNINLDLNKRSKEQAYSAFGTLNTYQLKADNTQEPVDAFELKCN